MVHIWYFIAVLGFVQSECPLGWLHFKEGCYLFSKEHLSWYTAQSSCRAHNARLAEVETKDLSDYLISVAKLLDKSVDYWLGGRDDAIDGTWFWSSSDRVFTYSEWGPGEPNGYRYENCVDMFVGHQWKWNDANCSSSQYYICEKKYPVSDQIIG
ncbi:perlucin-like protein [Mytilus galloprovincialis]|uniref:perlucin-like protein n=1 Tax=Mytilus galloprovincialis TaxID=29158 RepID=UPI003F7C5977